MYRSSSRFSDDAKPFINGEGYLHMVMGNKAQLGIILMDLTNCTLATTFEIHTSPVEDFGKNVPGV